MQAQTRRFRAGAWVAAACAALLATPAAASLVGSKVTYIYGFPTLSTPHVVLGTQTVANGTLVHDPFGEVNLFFVGNQAVVLNNVPGTFDPVPFNGPQLVFGDGTVTGASVDPLSSGDFIGPLSFTGDSVSANYTGITAAVGSSSIIDIASTAPLQGQNFTYNFLFPNAGNVEESFAKGPLVDTTAFWDNTDGVLVAVGADKVTILNLEPEPFAGGAFNGPTLTFSGVDITGASIDPTSASDFLGTLSTTHDSLAVNFSALGAPALGHALVIDVSALAVPEPSQWALMIAGLGLVGVAMRRSRSRTAMSGSGA